MFKPLTHRFDEAMLYAHYWHVNQRCRGTAIPYISHPLAVASIVLEHGGTEDEVIAALLHDAVKDGPRNTGEPRPLIERQISDRFGEKVVKIISGCAIPDSQDPQQNWQAQREIYLQQLETIDQSALLVAAAEKLHNLQSLLLARRNIGEQVWQHCEADRQGSLWYLSRLGELLGRRWPSSLTTELLIAIQHLTEMRLPEPPLMSSTDTEEKDPSIYK